jgi:RimJ/RimL family protein N-acetyltransferase
MWRYDVGGRLWFQPITEDDAYLICKLRNMDNAREMFFIQDVVTPDTHIMFMKNRKPHDLIWTIWVKEFNAPIGITSLTIDPKEYTAEYGRAFIDPRYRNKGYGQEQEYMVLSLAFDFFNLKYLWGDVLVGNSAAIGLHHKTGWKGVGINVSGHTNERGDVLHIEYHRSWWDKQKFIDEFGVTL